MRERRLKDAAAVVFLGRPLLTFGQRSTSIPTAILIAIPPPPFPSFPQGAVGALARHMSGMVVPEPGSFDPYLLAAGRAPQPNPGRPSGGRNRLNNDRNEGPSRLLMASGPRPAG